MRPTAILVAAGASVIAVGVLIAAITLRQSTPRSVSPPPSPYRGSIPPQGIRASGLTLRDYRGGLVAMRKLRGKVVVVSFVDSKCTQQCPIVVSVIAAAMHQLTRNERRTVMPLLISVNPRLDTAQSVRDFLERRRALALSYLVGTVKQMRPIWKAYGILPAIDTGDADVHSSDVRIFDRRGIWVSTQHAGVDLTATNLVHDVELALRP